jgi:hypothetical protein
LGGADIGNYFINYCLLPLRAKTPLKAKILDEAGNYNRQIRLAQQLNTRIIVFDGNPGHVPYCLAVVIAI